MPCWSRADVAARILAGDFLIIYNGHLLRIPDSWLDAHPGGKLAILHFVGRDATDEIQAYHLDDTLTLIPRYSIGPVDIPPSGWDPLLPPLMSGWVRSFGPDGNRTWFNEAHAVRPASHVLLVEKDKLQYTHHEPTLDAIQPPPTALSLDIQTAHSKAYRQLHKRIIDAGLYKTPYLTGYGPEIFRYVLLGTLSAYAYANSWFMTSAVFLGLMWHQLVFSAHDLGHMGVTHNWAIDRLLAILIADFIGGLSIGWWVDVSCSFSSRCKIELTLNRTTTSIIVRLFFSLPKRLLTSFIVVTNHPSQYVTTLPQSVF
jgi:delta8-fatty-acid desaturase